MVKKIDRTGEENVNNFGSKMIISKYNNARDIDVYFPEYDYTISHVQYGDFKKGNLKCSYERRIYGVGYMGMGEYSSCENGELTRQYKIWCGMLMRCYDPKYLEKYPSYNACEVCESWHNFQNFAHWYENNYYQIPGDIMCLDKDILFKGNKVYSRETCIFVPNRINTLFVKCNKSRGGLPIGVYYHKQNGKYISQCNFGDGQKNLGSFDNPEKAFQVYKEYKEKYIKEVIDSYEGIIPEPHYSKLKNAIYNYKVEIND